MLQQRARLTLLAATLLLLAWPVVAAAEPDGGDGGLPGPFSRIRVVDFEFSPIDRMPSAYTRRHLEAAEENGADCVVLRIDSPGGTVFHSLEIADALLTLTDDIYVVAWIPEMAYSGAAMVALACDEIVMGRSAHMGDSQPGTHSVEGWTEAGEKLETVLRAKFRGYAERNGYPELLAGAMVSARDEVLKLRDPRGRTHYMKGPDFRDMAPDTEAFPGAYPGLLRMDLKQIGAPVVRVDELLTLTTSEARQHGFVRRAFAEGRFYAETEDELLEALKAEDAVVTFVEPTFSENATELLLQISGILSAIIAIAVALLIFQGPGLMTIAGGAALVVVLLISATADLLNGFPIFLLALGFILFLAEVFIIPGFGVAGILGFVAMGTGFLFLAAGATIGDTEGLGPVAFDFSLQFLATILAGFVAFLLLSRFFPAIGPGRRMLLAPPDAPPVTSDTVTTKAPRVGARGLAMSSLRPSGTAEIDGRMVDVVTDGDWVRGGARVEVAAVEGNRITVRSLEEPEDTEDDL